VQTYEHVLRARVTLLYEDRAMLELLTRAAAALPPEARARFRELYGKAIGAALSGAPSSAVQSGSLPLEPLK
jgi:hypothetical protein